MRKVLAALLAAGLAIPPATFANPAKPAQQDDLKNFKIKLSKDDLTLHALDRLTFGPRPGDPAAVRRIGLKKWIDLQLNPERIPQNPALAAKHQPLDSLRMTEAETALHYPPPQLIRAVAAGRQPFPDDPIQRAAVERGVRRFKVKKADSEKDDVVEPAKMLEDVLTPDQVKILRSGAPEKKKDLLASMPVEQLDDTLIAMPQGLRGGLLNVVNAETRRKIMLLNSPQQVVGNDLSEGKLYRAIYSNRQLEELVTDFWYNHFNIFLDKGNDRFMVPTYERDSIRPHVFGNFRDLLEATSHSPAMLFYLDNWQSVAPKPADQNIAAKQPKRAARGLNENYARELLELHTLGVDGGYTQKDIIEVARCFTGWTIKDPRKGGVFQFNDKVHDKGEKLVLGVTIPAGGGESDGEKVLDILLHHASTAHFISKKLAMRFVADNPPATLVDRMAATFRKTNGDIRQVMRTMLDSKEFWSAGAYQSKVKTPFEMVVSAVRALDADVENAYPLSNQITNLGQPLYRKIEPTGYSSANAEWINSASLLARMNFALQLAQNRIPGVKVDATKFDSDPAAIAKAVLFRDVTPQTKAALETAMNNQKTKTPAQIAGLVLGSPDFQRR